MEVHFYKIGFSSSLKLSSTRALKSSLKDLMTLPPWEVLSNYWKLNILTEIHPVWKKDPRYLCGVLLDPVEFFPCVMTRFLMRMEREGTPLAPGNYAAEKKLGCDAGRHNWFRWTGGNNRLGAIVGIKSVSKVVWNWSKSSWWLGFFNSG